MHQPSLIAASKNLALVSSEPYKRWNSRQTGNYTASSQTIYLRNYHPLSLALLMRHTFCKTIFCQFEVVAETTIDRVGMRSENTSTRFFYGLRRGKQLVQLLWPCGRMLIKNEKIAGPKLSITSISRAPVDWHEIELTI